MPDAVGPTRADTWAVSVRVQDVGKTDKPWMPLGIWDKREGGEIDSEEFKYNPGAMSASVSLGGRKVIGNVTVSRLYGLLRDHHTVMQALISGAGRAKAEVSADPMDIDGNNSNRPIVWSGTLKRVTPPDVDSESSDAAMIELEITVEGEPYVGT